MATIESHSDGDRRIFLREVPWTTYQALRDEPANWHIRMTYDRGHLEMMSPSRRHERVASSIGDLVTVWCMELFIPLDSCRNMTLRREDLDRGLEPDNCYYIHNEPLVREKDELDFTVDPPPDLAIEVDLASSSVNKMPIYAALGVPELWRYSRKQITVYGLDENGQYARRETSLCLPDLPIMKILEFVERMMTMGKTEGLIAFRDWIREEILPRRKKNA